VKTIVRTKSGRLIEKTIMVSKEEYDELQRIAREGGDPASVLNKYMGKDEKVEGWSCEDYGANQKRQTGKSCPLSYLSLAYRMSHFNKEYNFIKHQAPNFV